MTKDWTTERARHLRTAAAFEYLAETRRVAGQGGALPEPPEHLRPAAAEVALSELVAGMEDGLANGVSYATVRAAVELLRGLSEDAAAEVANRVSERIKNQWKPVGDGIPGFWEGDTGSNFLESLARLHRVAAGEGGAA